MRAEPLIDESAKERGYQSTPGFVDVVDKMEALGGKNWLLVQIRDDGAVESYCNAQSTERIDNPSEYLMLAAVETITRSALAAQGKKCPKSGSEEWARQLARHLVRLAKRFMEQIDE